MNHIEIASHRSHHGNFYLEDDNDSNISIDMNDKKKMKDKNKTTVFKSATNLE